ncbi:MAG TPA: DinB family protein [bacterium]|nr:DinB family protein [bacterium]
MIEYVRTVFASQFEASLAMLDHCVRQCPEPHWDGRVAKYPFWEIAYHTLCFVDLYLSSGEAEFQPRDIHPGALRDIFEETPTRRFEQRELTEYAAICRRQAIGVIAAETPESLRRPSGFSWLPMTRGELHIYNIRHIQHHSGQLSAYLRRVEPAWQDPNMLRWVKTGWA